MYVCACACARVCANWDVVVSDTRLVCGVSYRILARQRKLCQVIKTHHNEGLGLACQQKISGGQLNLVGDN